MPVQDKVKEIRRNEIITDKSGFKFKVECWDVSLVVLRDADSGLVFYNWREMRQLFGVGDDR